SNAAAYTISGCSVVVACGDAKDTEEELSTIAHKLRDVLDPDGLFMLVETGGGIQMIARSTTDQINVGEVTAQFGGGGHARAAAALVKSAAVKDTQAKLLEILEKIVQPSVTVAEIMSGEPQLLSPDTPVKEVAAKMQRYGYEGFPVVDKGKVIGLLTRRAVDRTISHKLNLKARDVMEAGQAVVSWQASIDELQKIMTDTGWGQIPVTRSADGEIIGIVTRTDVLKIISPQAPRGKRNLSSLLEGSLPAARLALLRAVTTVQDNNKALYIVGGFVRDLLLERPSLDFDIVVEGDAIALGQALVDRYGGRITTHRRFGTAKWQIAKIRSSLAKALKKEVQITLDAADLPDTLDLISARREFYTHPTALPTVERGSIKLDLHRRDFTFNTLALRLDGRHYGELHDYWGGLSDLENKIVRVLHSLSFLDDPTRILRAIRFEKRFDYKIEQRTYELMEAAVPLIAGLSGDRLRHEFNIMHQEENAGEMFTRMEDLGVLAAISPDLKWGTASQARVAKIPAEQPAEEWNLQVQSDGYPLALALTYILWLIDLPSTAAAAVLGRLKVPGWLTKSVIAACKIREDLDRFSAALPSQIVEFLEDQPPLALYAHFLLAEKQEVRDMIENFITRWRHIQPQTSGHDLRARKMPPGPQYSRILQVLRAGWLNGEIKSPDEEAQLLETLLNDGP
ncbi:MAG: CBS domain-containing protein, partial [Anaerolineae bacterium]|nr:CBS domain-containing protein [Anaerolineae bacterium]